MDVTKYVLCGSAGVCALLLAGSSIAQGGGDLLFADGYEPFAPTTIPAAAVAPWPAFQYRDALQTASRSGVTTVWGAYFERSEAAFEMAAVEQTQELGNAANGATATYADVDLGSGTDAIAMRVSLPIGASTVVNTIEVRIGSATGPLAGQCAVGSTGGAESYRTIGCVVDPALARGRQTVVLRFVGAQAAMRLNWFAWYARDTEQRIDTLIKRQNDSMVNRPAPVTPMAGSPVRSRSQLPATSDPRAQSFGLWTPTATGDCPGWMHDTYWVRGDDGKAYPTWHPPVDFDPEAGRYCTYGHEHGDDPRASQAFAVVGMPAFGYVNEQDSPGNASLQRREDHYGHKVFVGNDWQMYHADMPGTRSCDVMIKQHMGTHSADAFTNTAHEVSFAGQCDGLQPFDVRQFALFGAPGAFKEPETDGCGLAVDSGLPPNPPTQPLGGIHRAIPTRDCYTRGTTTDPSTAADARTVEFWLTGMLGGDLYTAVHNPARYFEPAFPSRLGRTVDLCRSASHPLSGTLSCQLANASSASAVQWNDPRSPFRGSVHRGHHFSALRFANSPTAVLYTNSYGQELRATPDPARGITVRQRVPTVGFYLRVDGHQSLFPDVDYAAGGRNGVRAPN